MTFNEAVEFLFTRLPMFTRDGKRAFKKDLTNIRLLCEWLGNPHLKYKTIHIAGTNGKGSTSHMIAAILQTAGYKTGLYTSPHIRDFRERIRVNGILADEQFVIDFTQKVKGKIDEIEPSYFEITVAMAFEYFAQQNVDVAVIETGLGGVLDSTNIVQPELSIITNIGIDHINILGGTLEKIAGQKAGIIKPDIPVVIGEYLPETKPVFENVAHLRNAPVIWAQDLYETSGYNQQGGKLSVAVTDRTNGHTEEFQLDLRGKYQVKNLKTVLAAEKVLIEKGFRITEADEKHALANVAGITGLRGRWEKIEGDPTIILDVGHNEDGIKLVLEQLQEEYPYNRVHFILGFVRDKEVGKVLTMFPKDQQYYFTQAHIPRALPVDALYETAIEAGLTGETFGHINDALIAARKNAAPGDVIMVVGSFFTMAEIDENLLTQAQMA